MSTSMMALGVTVKLFDQMSGGMGRIVQHVDGLRGKLQGLHDTAQKLGRDSIANGLIAGGATMKTVSAFAALEDASTRLKVTMMDKDGLTGAFQQVNALAVKLGNELPGTSADFLNMMAALKAQGLTDQSILAGVGEAAGKMAVLLKKPPEEMAVFAAKLKTAMGVADSEMLGFMDTIQRTVFMGVDATEMMYAFARSGGALKTIKQQGLEASKALAPLFAIWVKGGLSGETVGTGFASITATLLDAKKVGKANALLAAHNMPTLNFKDKKGNFLGIDNMIAQFDKLKGLSAGNLNTVLHEMFGGGQDQQMIATLVTTGVEGYRKQVEAMEQQADLQKRVGIQLGTLKNLWDAASGTFTNTLAGFAEAMGPELKTLTNWFGELSEWLGRMFKEFPQLTKWLGLAALGFSAIAIVGGGVALAVAAFTSGIGFLVPALLSGVGGLAMLLSAFSAVGAFMLANPITIAIALLAAAAGLIYENWGPIKDFFVGLWEGIKTTVGQAVEWIGAKLRSMSDMLPEWVTKYTLPGAAIKLAADAMGPAQPNAVTPGGARANVGGKVVVEVKDPGGMVTGVSARSDNRDVPLALDNGLSMVAP